MTPFKRIKFSLVSLTLFFLTLNACASEGNDTDKRRIRVGNNESMQMMNSRMIGINQDLRVMMFTLNRVRRERDLEAKNMLWKKHALQMRDHMVEVEGVMGMMKGLLGQDSFEVVRQRKKMRNVMGQMEEAIKQTGYMVDKDLNMCVGESVITRQ